jgi:pyruvate formate lyase activating enzyme
LERIQQVRASPRHLEISQLIITDLNDSEEKIGQTIDWHLENLGEDIPLHFVRFHPAFRYTDVGRTPQEILHRAAEMGRDSGIKHVYLGNLTDPGVSDTRCSECDAILVARYGLSTEVIGISSGGLCTSCQAPSPIVEPFAAKPRTTIAQDHGDLPPQIEHVHLWTSEVNSIHVEIQDPNTDPVSVFIEHGNEAADEHLRLGGKLSRVLVSRRSESERQITLRWTESSNIRVMPVLDRAHLYTGEN